MLIGRDADLERINKAVLNRSLVVLDGDSGVGKSSFLQNGLFSWLRSKTGVGVLVNRNWTGAFTLDDSDARIETYIAEGIKKTHAESAIELPARVQLEEFETDGLCSRLDKAYKDSAAVLILDQFEELLRQAPGRARRVVDWIINIGFRSRTRVVISLRTDSLHQLDPLLRGVKPFSMDRVRLREIDVHADIRRVIRTTRRALAGSQNATGVQAETLPHYEPITERATDRLMEMWCEHTPKLLDLQATLYALYFSALRRGGAIDLQDVEELAENASSAKAKAAKRTPFTLGLTDAIRLKIEHAVEACRATGIDEYLLSGTLEVVKRAAPHLSSGDFKVPMNQFVLAGRCLDRELNVLEHALHQEQRLSAGATVTSLFHELLQAGDFLAVRAKKIASVKNLLDVAGGQNQAHPRRDLTAGPMMHRTATATLFEEVRRVAFALKWLEETEITRKDPDGTLLLVHDRAGEALKDWVEAQDEEPEQALRQLTGARGEHFLWEKAKSGKRLGIGNLDDSLKGCQVFANVNWRDCRISTWFRKVVFVNCDFSGSRFDHCSFEGVTFVNCLLDDTNFEFCEIKGRPEFQVERHAPTVEGKGGKSRLAPSFTVEASADEVRNFVAYLEDREPGPPRSWGWRRSIRRLAGRDRSRDRTRLARHRGVFFSDTSGVAAVPGAPPSDHAGELLAHFATAGKPRKSFVRRRRVASDMVVRVTPPTGGVAMVGGRLCFLTLYRCIADPQDGGSFALHHVSGGGLDIVEQHGGSIDIHDGAIRGISVTRDRDDMEDTGSSGRGPHVNLTVNDSLVVNVYFADDLTGLARFQNTFVLMLLNGSDRSKFQVQIQDCRYQFLVNTDVPDGDEDGSFPEERRYFDRIDGYHSRFTTPNRPLLARDLEAMDYRSRPELWERRQRKRRADARSAPAAAEPDAPPSQPDEPGAARAARAEEPS